MPAYGRRLRIRLFLEGVEVPIISANVRSAPNSPTVASLQVPPLPEGTRLLPRTIVHLFFLDDFEVNTPQLRTSAKKTQENESNPTEAQRDIEESDQLINDLAEQGPAENFINAPVGTSITQYKLLFGGEVVGFVWNKTSTQRALVLQCQDWSNYWDYAFQHNNTDIFGPGKKAVFSGASTDLFTDFLETKGSTLTKIIKSGRCNSFPTLKGVAAGIIRMMELVGGTYYPSPGIRNNRRVKGQNIFFSLAELRLHINHMVAAYEKDPTSQHLLRRHGWGGLFNRTIGGLGRQTSIRKVINAISGIIFYETFGQPCPYYKPGLDNTVMGQRRMKLSESTEYNYLASSAERLEGALIGLSASFRLATDPARLERAGGKQIFRQMNLRKLQIIRRDLNRLQASPDTKRAPAAARSILSQASRNVGKATTEAIRWRPDAPESRQKALTQALDNATSQLNRLKRLTVNVTPKGEQLPARLNQHIFRPDIWFGAPPRCNVLFPENYDSLAYQRMFLAEPTRFMLKTNDEFFGEDFLFDKFYFAPQTGSLKKDRANLRDMLRRDLLEHELFTGILPVFEKMGEFNVFASEGKGLFRSGQQSNQRVKKGDVKNVEFKEGYAQRAANFLYFKHRFNSRQMTVSGRFNPHIAVGFPGLIIDKYVNQATLQLHNELRKVAGVSQRELSEVLGTNFLGNFTAVSHSVSQADSRGTTEITCSYPRQPEESVQFLGVSEKASTVRKKVGGEATRNTVVAALDAPRPYSLGPNKGRIEHVLDVTSDYSLGGKRSVYAELPLFSASRRAGAKEVFVPISIELRYEDLPQEARELVSEPTDSDASLEEIGVYRKFVFKAFSIDEKIPRYQKQEVEQPMELLLHPGWYDQVWSPSKIGAVYEDFFGTGAITDPQIVTDLGAGVRSEDAESASDEKATATSENDPRADAPAISGIEEGSSIQSAVDFLVLTYSYIKQNGLDVDEFIRGYTWRPVASMVDMFGTTDLQFSPDGEEVLEGKEGFHSRAFGPYDNLFGLVTPEITDLLGIKRGSTVAQKGDVRKRRREAVLKYIAALQLSRGVLG